MAFILCLMAFVISAVLAKDRTESSFEIVYLRPYYGATTRDTNSSIVAITSNTTLSIKESPVAMELQPFSLIRSLVENESQKLFIVNNQVCEGDVIYTYGMRTSATCHIQYSHVTMASSTCSNKDQCPVDTLMCDVFGQSASSAVERTLAELVTRLQWTHVYIYYDSSMEQLQGKVSDKLSKSGVLLTWRLVRDGERGSDLHEELFHHYQHSAHDTTSSTNFIVLCGHTCINTLMLMVDGFDRRNGNTTALWLFSNWLLYGASMDTAIETHLTLNNVASLVIPQVSTDGNIYEPSLVDDLGRVYSQCVNKSEGHIGTQMKDILENDTSCWRGRIETLLYKSDGRAYDLVGDFDIQGKSSVETELFPNADMGFNERTLNVGTMPLFPFVMETNRSLGFEGLCIDLLKQLASTLNFTFSLRKPGDGEWGRVAENGSWTGLVAGLQNREFDLVVAPLTVNIQRQSVIDFTIPFFYDHATGVFKMPDPSASKWQKLIKPFKGRVLLCLAIALFTVAVLLCVVESSTDSLRNNHHTSVHLIFQESIWYLYGAMLAHGGAQQPRSEAGRVLIGFWWLFCIIIAASYSGTLIAFLTVNKETPPFLTLQDVAEQEAYTWGTNGGSSWLQYFQETPGSDISKLWSGMESFSREDADTLSGDAEVQRERVLQGSYVYFADHEQLNMWTAQHCQLVHLKQSFYSFNYALGLPKQSPYGHLTSRTMLNIDQSGLFQTWKRKWWPRENLCLDVSFTTSTTIALDDLQSAFYLIAIGLTAASMVLVFEVVVLGKCYETKFNNSSKVKV